MVLEGVELVEFRHIARGKALDARETKVTVSRIAAFIRIWLRNLGHVVRGKALVTFVARRETLVVVIDWGQVLLVIVAMARLTVFMTIASGVWFRPKDLGLVNRTIGFRLVDLWHIVRTVATLVGLWLDNLGNVVRHQALFALVARREALVVVVYRSQLRLVLVAVVFALLSFQVVMGTYSRVERTQNLGLTVAVTWRVVAVWVGVLIDSSTVAIFMLIRFPLVIVIMSSMTVANFFVRDRVIVAWHVLGFVFLAVCTAVVVVIIVIVLWDTPVVMVVVIRVPRPVIVVVVNWVVEVATRVLVFADHAAANRIDEQSIVVGVGHNVKD